MKCILNIGGSIWLVESAATAAKVADLLSTCKPLDQLFQENLNHLPGHVFIHKRDYSHDVKIEQVTPKMTLLKDHKELLELFEKPEEAK